MALSWEQYDRMQEQAETGRFLDKIMKLVHSEISDLVLVSYSEDNKGDEHFCLGLKGEAIHAVHRWNDDRSDDENFQDYANAILARVKEKSCQS